MLGITYWLTKCCLSRMKYKHNCFNTWNVASEKLTPMLILVECVSETDFATVEFGKNKQSSKYWQSYNFNRA